MRLTRRIVTIAAASCAPRLAACGKQVVAHVTASDSVHSALTSVFTSRRLSTSSRYKVYPGRPPAPKAASQS